LEEYHDDFEEYQDDFEEDEESILEVYYSDDEKYQFINQYFTE
jgi:hypothetical protein